MAEITVAASIGQILGTASPAATGTINGGQLNDIEAQAVGEAVRTHLTAVSPDAPSRCIDGRPCVSTVAGGATQPRPAVAGGAVVTAHAGALLTDWFDTEVSTQADRLARIHAALTAAGLHVGTHCDQHAFDAQFIDIDKQTTVTGCGADDRLPEILGKFDTASDVIATLTASLLGDAYDPTAMPQSGVTITDWNPKEVIDEIADNAGIEILASPEGQVNHGHAECAVIFNYVADTTLERDSFTEDTGKQVFTVDMWYVNTLAHALADERDDVSYDKLQHAMVAYQVATYLTLCDGSQRLIVVR